MPSGNEYRIKAAEMIARAKQEASPIMRSQLENLALAYRRLADQADKNAMADIMYETPAEQRSVQQQQQQQQRQPKTDEDS